MVTPKISLQEENDLLEQRIKNKRLIELFKRDIPPQYDTDIVCNYYLKAVLEPQKYLSRILKKYVDLKDKRILEIGCGSGFDCLDLAEEGAIVSGLEISEGRLEFSIELMKEKNIRYNLIRGDACLLSLEKSAYDIIICKHLIEHLESPQKRIAEFIDLLKPDGILYIDFPNRYSIKQIISDDHYNMPFIVLLPRPVAKFIITRVVKYEKEYSTERFLSPIFFRKIMKKLGLEYSYVSPDFEFLEKKIKNPETISSRLPRKLIVIGKKFGLIDLFLRLLRNKYFQTILFPNFTAIVFKGKQV